MGDCGLTGGCNCGKVRYTVAGRPYAVAACHCINCRKQSGAAFSVNLIVSAQAVTVVGELSAYSDPHSESGLPVVREFCGTCGSPIRSVPQSSPATVAIKAGTLDDPSPYEPQVHIWTCTALDWVHIPADVARFEKGPERA